MATTIAQLMVRVGADTKAAEAQLGAVGKMMGKTGPIALGAAVVAGSVAIIGGVAIKMAGDFQAGMTSLVTGAGESRDNLKLVSDGILKMATDTGTSTKQLTDGMFMIESAGFHGKAGLDVLKVAAEGAKVGNADLGTTADALTTILKDFPNVTGGATGAMNTLVATVANGKTHMEDLGQSLAMILPTASSAHIGLNDVMGAMATMTGEGVPAANAATYLRQTILALDAPSKQAKDALASVGLTTQDVSSAMQKSLPDALKMITDHLSKKFKPGSAQYIAALKDIAGGSKEIQGVLDLTGTHMNDFQTNVGNVGSAVKKGGKDVTGFADVQKTMNFQFSRAKEAVETVMISLGTKLLPVATKVFGWVADTAIPALRNFVHWISGSSASANIIRPILIALGIAIAGALVAAFISWAIAAGAAAIATIAATWPILAIGAAIALLIAGIVLLFKHWSGISAWLGGVWHGIVGGVMAGIHAVWNVLKGVGGWIGGVFTSIWHGLGGAISSVWDGIMGAIKNAVNTIIGIIDWVISAIDKIHVHIPKVGPIGGGDIGFNIGLIPKLAEGGTARTGGAAIVGDDGPELLNLPTGASIIPLPSGLPTGANSGPRDGGGAPQVVQLIVDGRKLAEVVVRHQPGVIRQATGVRSF